MLVIRKELKVGLGIGAAVLGVAIVYGGMAALSGSSGKSDPAAQGDSNAETIHIDAGAGPSGLETARAGLPPVEGAAPETPAAVASNDPWAESARTDGSNNDEKWTIALNTGRISTDTTPAFNNTRTAPEGPLVTTKLPEAPANTGNPVPGTLASNGIERSAERTVERSGERVSPGSPGSAKYTIQAGDTFSSIAAKIYGNRNLYHLIEKANPSVNPGRLKIGQEINVPAKESIRTERGSIDTTPAVTGAIDATRQYRVQPGDTLHKISQKLYGKTGFWTSIYELNKQAIGPNAGKLKVGMVLELPNVPSAP